MKLKLIMGLLALSFLSGCAFTVHDLPVNYEYTKAIDLPHKANYPEINITDVVDVRTVANPRMIMNQQNGYGQTTTGGWQAEKELSLIIKDALVQGVKQAKLDQFSGRKVQLSGELVDVTSNIVAGWTSGTINMKVSVKLTARDVGTGKILWKDTMFGDGTSSKKSAIKPLLVEAFSNSLDDLVDNLFSDEYFQQSVLD